MPIIDKLRITPGTGALTFGDGWTGDLVSGATDTLIIETPSAGVQLFDSLYQVADISVLALRNVVGTGSVTVSEKDGVITIDGIASTTSASLIASHHVMANIRQVPGTPVGTTLSNLIDLAAGNQAGSMLFRSESRWTILPPGPPGLILQMDTNGLPEWKTISSSLIASVSGQPQSAQQIFTIPVLFPFSIPANCVGSVAVSAVPAAATTRFFLSYIRDASRIPVELGWIVWNASDYNGTFHTTSAYNAQLGDVFILTAPTVVDSTLSDIGISIVVTRR